MNISAQILAELKTKYANLGFSEQVLTGVSTFLAAQVTEENQIEGVVASAEKLLKPFQSDLDASRNAKVKAENKLKELEKPKTGKLPKRSKQIVVTPTSMDNEVSAGVVSINICVPLITVDGISEKNKKRIDDIEKKLRDFFDTTYSQN